MVFCTFCHFYCCYYYLFVVVLFIGIINLSNVPSTIGKIELKKKYLLPSHSKVELAGPTNQQPFEHSLHLQTIHHAPYSYSCTVRQQNKALEHRFKLTELNDIIKVVDEFTPDLERFSSIRTSNAPNLKSVCLFLHI